MASPHWVFLGSVLVALGALRQAFSASQGFFWYLDDGVVRLAFDKGFWRDKELVGWTGVCTGSVLVAIGSFLAVIGK